MDPIIENDWLGTKQEALEEEQNVPNLTRSWLGREMDIEPLQGPSNKTVLENLAEDILVQKTLTSRCCDLPGYPRSTFLMVFSPDGTKVASTHGNHNVYVSELASGKHVRILKGHPRTPWCIAFHPSHPQLIGSGCLGGQVRVWDLSGGSEVWTVSNETVIASMAFHPRDQLLVIATFNELYFWDWSQAAPLTKVCTRNTNEKVRYVAFDSLGYKLITGISVVWSMRTSSNSTSQNTPSNQTSPNTNNEGSPGGGGDQRPDQPSDREAQLQARMVDQTFNHNIVFNSYHNLVQRYDSLVRNYRRLFLARHRLSGSPVNTTDRGTDPMEADTSLRNGHSSRAFRPWTPQEEGPSRPQNVVDSVEGEASSSRLLSLDVLSINGDPTRSVDSNDINDSLFGSRTSAFQRFTDELNAQAAVDSERPPRLLLNPFSPSAAQHFTDGSSRTTVFTSRRLDSPSARYFLQRRRNATQNIQTSTSTSTNTFPQDDELSRSLFLESRRRANPRSESNRLTSAHPRIRLSPAAEQTINESLDLIRDILRDSGTRLLNLITNMSLSTLANVERSIPRRQRSSLTESDGSDVLNSSLRRDLFISESDSDSDRSARDSSRTSSAQDEGSRTTHLSHDHSYHSTRRLVVDLNEDLHSDESVANESNRPNVSSSPGRFRVRSHSTEENASRGNNARTQSEAPDADGSQPSTSADTSWVGDAFQMGPAMSSSEAISKVKTGVGMLRRHTAQLTEIWLRGSPMSMAELRNTWEDLRRRIVALNRSNNPTEVPRYFTRNLIDRCRHLTETLRNSYSHRNVHLNNDMRNRERSRRYNEENGQAPTSTDSTSSSIATEPEDRASRNDLHTTFFRMMQRARTGRRRAVSTRRADEELPPRRRPHADEEVPPSRRPRADNEVPPSRRPRAAEEVPPSRRPRADEEVPPSRRPRADEEVPPSRRPRADGEVPQSRRLRSDEAAPPRRRPRAPHAPRWCVRHPARAMRRDLSRSFEVHCTRHEIRMRAMQVLSIMFNIMMSCLERRMLSQIIVNMLQTLKKALTLTCLMLVTNRLTRRTNQTQTRGEQAAEEGSAAAEAEPGTSGRSRQAESDAAARAIRLNIFNSIIRHRHRDNNFTSLLPVSDSEDEDVPRNKKKKIRTNATSGEPNENESTSSTAQPPQTSRTTVATQRWSNRLAVQISAANRNTSLTARRRHAFYVESRRLKALHRTNPLAHPITRRKIKPPISTHRIPIVRRLPPTPKKTKTVTTETNRPASSVNEEPVAGTSNSQPGPSGEGNSPRDGTSRDALNDFEHRVNLVRIAHMHAVRMRNAARNRFRRLQTIRLYTPSAVREMFAIQSNNNDLPNPSDSQNQPTLNNAADVMYPASLSLYRPHILTTRNDIGNRAEGLRQYDYVIPVDEGAPNEPQNGQIQRIARVHEYLQPIILGQNALVVEEGGGGGGLGHLHLDSGSLPEALPPSAHRVQAWDFSSGTTPDIGDNSKNIVVARCRIHNDASIDISKDGKILVALLPVPRFRNGHDVLGVYSLEWGQLGQCLYTAVLEQSAVSVALSPTARHLAVGLGSRRFTTLPHARNNVFALIYNLAAKKKSTRNGLTPVKELEQNWEQGFTSLNCLRWAPQPGQGLVYANNTGQLIIMS